MLALDAFISKYTHIVAIDYNGGEHPCHDIMNYKQFYIDRITPEDVALDVGSHEGDIAYAIANGTGARVIGIELLQERHEKAVRQNSHPLITFHCGDALTLPIEEKVTVIVLSAILEHIVDRDTFLKTLVARYQPNKILIRVPMFTREWRVPMRKQLGMNYFMDSTHYIEYTLPEFKAEMAEANLEIDTLNIEWGEIWAVVKPIGIVQKSELESLGQLTA
jgi:2-polyprenyl-3-methyl-5-hydroxy-6-metoxy-1,4-benzoquinol methylase